MHKALYQQLSDLIKDDEVKTLIDPSLYQRALTVINNEQTYKKPVKIPLQVVSKKIESQFNRKGTPNIQKQKNNKLNKTNKIKHSTSHKTILLQDDENYTQDTRTSTLKRPLQQNKDKKMINNLSLILSKQNTDQEQKGIDCNEIFNTQQQTQQTKVNSKMLTQFEYLPVIAQKQKQLLKEKNYYENRASQLKNLIEKEKNSLTQIEKSTIILQQQLAKNLKKYQGEHHSTLLKRKLQNIFQQVKNINTSYEELEEQNSKVKDSITEEKQLIGMYKTVIEELKSQMKIEKSEFETIKKQLQILRKSQKATKMKYEATNQDVEGVVGIIKESIDKWKK